MQSIETTPLHAAAPQTATLPDTIRPETTLPAADVRSHPLLAAIGHTPLIELTRVGDLPGGVRLLAKAEFMNPGGSIKDRAAAEMVADGIDRGLLTVPSPGQAPAEVPTIIDATSGNTGIAFAMIGASLGIPVTLVMPENTSPERKATMRHLGATVIDTVPAEDGSDGAFEMVREIVAANPGRYFYPDQYDNPANTRAHEWGTGAEIWQQSGGTVTHFVASMGTSGTLMGTSRRLKRENSSVRSIAVQPDSPLHGIEGTKHMASTIRPSILDDSIIDEVVVVSTARAYETTRRLALREGLFCGISSGANTAAALDVARRAEPGSVIVTVLPDTGSRYLSDHFWEAR
ncbi:MAG: cysteine synthase family protein [Acidipropionibacterium sp.]|nr:cysteine synthase family protein [Acidipropionibacterium sp.]